MRLSCSNRNVTQEGTFIFGSLHRWIWTGILFSNYNMYFVYFYTQVFPKLKISMTTQKSPYFIIYWSYNMAHKEWNYGLSYVDLPGVMY